MSHQHTQESVYSLYNLRSVFSSETCWDDKYKHETRVKGGQNYLDLLEQFCYKDQNKSLQFWS